jgi:hypothetical protein
MSDAPSLGLLFADGPLGFTAAERRLLALERAAGGGPSGQDGPGPYARFIGLCGVTTPLAAARRMGAVLLAD